MSLYYTKVLLILTSYYNSQLDAFDKIFFQRLPLIIDGYVGNS